MKASLTDLERGLKTLNKTAVYLFHGPDGAGSRAMVARLSAALGDDVERLAILPAALKAEPALLANEAASFSLFGGARIILVEGAGDEILDAVTTLLAGEIEGNHVAIVAGVLKNTSKLLATVEAAPRGLALQSKVPEGRDSDRLVADLAGAVGLTVTSELARRLSEASGGNRVLISLELDKFALFLDATPDGPQPLSAEVIDALAAGSNDGDLSRVVDAVLDGETVSLDRELTQLASSGTEPMLALRALARRVLMLAKLRGEVERGNSVESAIASQGKAIFYKDRPALTRQLSRWSASRLRSALHRTLASERDLKAHAGLGRDAVAESLFAIAQSASRRKAV